MKALFYSLVMSLSILSTLCGLFAANFAISSAYASNHDPEFLNELRNAGDAYGNTNAGNPSDLRLTIFRLINIALGFIGTITLLIGLYAGFMWFTAAGDSGKVETAKLTLRNAVIGLIVIMMSYGIVTFVFRSLTPVTQDRGRVSPNYGKTGIGQTIRGWFGDSTPDPDSTIVQ